MGIKILITTLMLVTANSYAADVSRSSDASNFDVAGVRLGMRPAEASAAASAKLQIDRRAIEFDKFPQLNVVTKSKEPQYFIAQNGLNKLTVHFSPHVPFDRSNPMVVSSIRFEMPWTPENAKSMKSSAVEKYGPPSNGTLGATYDWCIQPSKNVGEGCFEFRGPKLRLSGTELELSDPRYQQEVIDFMNKSNSGKPAF